jgi:glycosyltransferase involved in cell wall biosynthesis
MSSSPLISVLIPTYNVSPFVEEAVRSIMQQTYYNLEIIVVDDCSTDDTYSLLSNMASGDSRIKLYRNETNQRIVETLNFALSQATGTFIARMDGDDVSAPNRLEKQFQFLMARPEIDLVGLSYCIVDEEGNTLKNEWHLTCFEYIKEATRFVSPVPHFWLARKKIYDVVGPYRIPGAEDYDFILRAIEKGFKLSNVPEILYQHRIRTGNTATTIGLRQKKSFAYVKKLQAERLADSRREDTYSRTNLAKWLQASAFERKTFKLSAELNHRFVSSKKRKSVASLYYLLLAILLSPKYMLTEKYNRSRYRAILRKEKNKSAAS